MTSFIARVARQLATTPAARLGGHPALHHGGKQSMTHLGGGVRGNGDAAAAGKHEAMRGLPEVRRSLVEVRVARVVVVV
jgi:hypothetical protein